jgi:hypothetical protein
VAVLIGAGVVAVLTLEGGISTSCGLYGYLGAASVFLCLLTLGFVGLVLWPRSNPWPLSIPAGAYTPTQVLYPAGRPSPGESVVSRATAALSTDWVSELTFELHKLAAIRVAKQFWYKWALVSAAVAVIAAAVRLFV